MDDGITTANAEKLNNDTPANQLVALGSQLKDTQDIIQDNNIVIFKYQISADATTALTMFTATFGFTITNIHVICSATNSGGTALVSESANSITDAMVMAVDKTVVNAGTIDDAYSVISTTDILKVKTNGAADRGLVVITGVRT